MSQFPAYTDADTLSQDGISENHPIWHAIDTGGGQACNIRGVIRELHKAGYAIVPRIPTEAMRCAKVENRGDLSGYLDDFTSREVWDHMLAASVEK